MWNLPHELIVHFGTVQLFWISGVTTRHEIYRECCPDWNGSGINISDFLVHKSVLFCPRICWTNLSADLWTFRRLERSEVLWPAGNIIIDTAQRDQCSRSHKNSGESYLKLHCWTLHRKAMQAGYEYILRRHLFTYCSTAVGTTIYSFSCTGLVKPAVCLCGCLSMGKCVS